LAILSLQIVLHIQFVDTYTTYCRNKCYTPKPSGLLVTVKKTKVKNLHGRHDITLPYKSITLLNFHVSPRIVTIYHFERRNVVSLVFLSPYVYTHSPCYVTVCMTNIRNCIDCQLHHVYHNFRANRSADSNFKLRGTLMHRQAGRDTEGQRSRQCDDP
jgi:hypothetical protein